MTVRVAAGVLRRADGQILIAQRPAGKIAAGRWEFPGGKIEAGESAQQALARELLEELGVTPRQARPLIRIRHAYTERTVELDTWLVEDWHGDLQAREGQALAWVSPARVWDYDLLEADAPIIDALRLPTVLPVTGAFASVDELVTRGLQLASQGHALLRLRAPQLDDAAYRHHAAALAASLADTECGLLIDRPGLSLEDAAVAGLQLRARDLAAHARQSMDARGWLFASCHDARDIALARELGVHAIVLGQVGETPSHPGRQPLGWARFAQLAEGANRPVYAIGGLGPDDLSRAFQAGAQGIAAISAYW